MDMELVEARRLFFRYFQPLGVPVAPADAAFLDGATRADVSFNDQQVLVYSWGEGPTVLLVHGGLGYGAQFKALVDPLQKAGYRVVLFDAPGHGRSVGHFVTCELAARVIEIIAERSAPVKAVVTHSMGCMWGLYAKQQGLACDAMVCLAPFADLRWVFRMFVAVQKASPAVAGHLERLLEAFEGPDSFGRFSPEQIARQLDARALVLHGGADTFVPSADGRRVADAWRGCLFELVPQANHMSILSEPSALERVVDFISAK